MSDFKAQICCSHCRHTREVTPDILQLLQVDSFAELEAATHRLTCTGCGLKVAVLEKRGFFASRQSGRQIIHLRHCHYIESLLPHQLIAFDSEAEALAGGYQPCQICLQPDDPLSF